MPVKQQDIPQTILQLYAVRKGVLMSPTFGLAVRTTRGAYACSVAHAIDERDEHLEVWTGVHPEVAQSFNMRSGAKRIYRADLSKENRAILRDQDADFMALPLPGYKGPALDARSDLHQGEISLLRKVLIAFLDYNPDERGTLERSGDGIAGLVTKETATHCTLTAAGCTGMSGAPALVRAPGGDYLWVGIYTGTPRTTPLTQKAVENFANIRKVGALLADL